MRATVLVDNIKNEELEAAGEWGLAIYIEHEGKKILLDTGSSDLFVTNARKLGISLEQVDFAVLSHAHCDHGGGMKEFFQENSQATMYLQKSCGEDCYYKKLFVRSYVGLPKNILKTFRNRITYVEGKKEVCDRVYLVPHTTEGLEKLGKRDNMYRKTKWGLRPDDFSHEHSLVIDTDRGLVIFNSCSHGGAVNIIREVRQAFPHKEVYGLIGGFHLFGKPADYVRQLGQEIKDTGISYVCTGHCTGKHAYKVLKEELGDTLHQLQVGLVIEV